jgi:hypothetical protein
MSVCECVFEMRGIEHDATVTCQSRGRKAEEMNMKVDGV